MPIINLQCNGLSQFKHFLQAENSMTSRACVHGGSYEPSLAEIHQEMSELLDKQMNAQKENLINFHGSCRLPQVHEKSVR